MDLFFNNLSNIARKSVHLINNSKFKNSSMDIWNLGKVLNHKKSSVSDVCVNNIFSFFTSYVIEFGIQFTFIHKKTESFEINTREKKRNLCMKNNPRIHNANIVVICRFSIELYVLNDGRRPQSIEWRIRNDSPPNLAANISNTPGFTGMLRFQRFSKLFG